MMLVIYIIIGFLFEDFFLQKKMFKNEFLNKKGKLKLSSSLIFNVLYPYYIYTKEMFKE